MLRKITRIVTILLLLIIVGLVSFLLWITFTDFDPDSRQLLAIENGSQESLHYSDTLTFITWNLGYAGLGREMDFFYDGGKMVRPSRDLNAKYLDGIMEQIKSELTADFYLFQEIDISSGRSYRVDQLTYLRETLPGYASSFASNYEVPFVPLPVYEPMGKVSSGIAIFSGMIPDSAVRYAFPGNFSWPMGLFFPYRCFIISYYKLDNGKKLAVINTHNSAFDDGSLRDAQMEYLSSVMLNEYEKGHYVVAGGDWNLNPPDFHTYLCQTGDAHYPIEPEMNEEVFPPEWEWAYDPLVPSNRFLNETYLRTRTYTTTLDYFLVSPNVEVINIRCFDLSFENSDHHPVRIQLKLQ